MQLSFNKNIYPKKALIKAAFAFTDKAYVHLDQIDNTFIVDIQMKDEYKNISEKGFINEMLIQTIRIYISDQTKNIRDLLYARAMSSTIVVEPDFEQLDEQNDNQIEINTILKDWFEINNETE